MRMNKNQKSIKPGKGVRTFFIYFTLVLFIIITAISVKALLLIEQSLFDGKYINIAISNNKKITEIIGFNAEKNTVSHLYIKNSKLIRHDLLDKLGILIDARIDYYSDVTNRDVLKLLTNAATEKDNIQTDLTIFDLARLWIIAKNSSGNKTIKKEISLPLPDYEIDKNIRSLFKNDAITSRSLSIEIINAASVPGAGKKLERALTNEGFNIISVSTKKEPENISKIKYTSESSYVVGKLKQILKYPAVKSNEKSIADVVIIIGEDKKKFFTN